MMDAIRQLGGTLKELQEKRAALTDEISAALQHEDYGQLGTLHMEHQRVLQAISATRRELGDTVIAWMEQS